MDVAGPIALLSPQPIPAGLSEAPSGDALAFLAALAEAKGDPAQSAVPAATDSNSGTVDLNDTGDAAQLAQPDLPLAAMIGWPDPLPDSRTAIETPEAPSYAPAPVVPLGGLDLPEKAATSMANSTLPHVQTGQKAHTSSPPNPDLSFSTHDEPRNPGPESNLSQEAPAPSGDGLPRQLFMPFALTGTVAPVKDEHPIPDAPSNGTPDPSAPLFSATAPIQPHGRASLLVESGPHSAAAGQKAQAKPARLVEDTFAPMSQVQTVAPETPPATVDAAATTAQPLRPRAEPSLAAQALPHRQSDGTLLAAAVLPAPKPPAAPDPASLAPPLPLPASLIGKDDTANPSALPETAFPVTVTSGKSQGGAPQPDSGAPQLSLFTASLSREGREPPTSKPRPERQTNPVSASGPAREKQGPTSADSVLSAANVTTGSPPDRTVSAPEAAHHGAEFQPQALSRAADPAPATTPLPRHTTATPHLAHQIGQQMADALSDAPAGRPVELTLSPEELGRVRMTLTSTDSGLTLAVLAERPETLDLMRRHIDQLAQDFRDLGHRNLTFAFSQGDHPSHGKQDQPPGATLFDAPIADPAPVISQTGRLAPSAVSPGRDLLDIRL